MPRLVSHREGFHVHLGLRDAIQFLSGTPPLPGEAGTRRGKVPKSVERKTKRLRSVGRGPTAASSALRVDLT